MLKLLKYELKGRQKLIIGGAIAVIVANLLLLFNYKLKGVDLSGPPDLASRILLLILFLTGVVGIILIMVDSVNILRKDLFSDTGSLLFTVPQNSYSILASKILTIIIEFLVFFILYIGFMFIHVYNFMRIYNIDYNLYREIMVFISDNKLQIFIILLNIVISLLSLSSVIYFSLVLTKSILKNNRHSGAVAFGIFILINIVIGKLSQWITQFMPGQIGTEKIYRSGNILLNISTMSMQNIVFDILVFAILFIATGYLLEKRTDI